MKKAVGFIMAMFHHSVDLNGSFEKRVGK